jgi:hypothetical protein
VREGVHSRPSYVGDLSLNSCTVDTVRVRDGHARPDKPAKQHAIWRFDARANEKLGVQEGRFNNL